MIKPKLYVLVGVPAAGKSTWIGSQAFDSARTVIISTDGHVERHAKEQGQTYNDVFHAYMPTAVKMMAADARDAIAKKLDIVWDQTSTSVAARAKKLRMVPADYEKIAVVFATPNKIEHDRRLASRPGKNIPPHVIASMQKSFEYPSESEGFDKIISVDSQ